MSAKMGRPPKENPRNMGINIRLTKSELQLIEECAEKLKTTRTDVLVKGAELVKSTIKE